MNTRVAVLNSATIEVARRHLRAVDPVMRRLIDAVGPFTLRLERKRRFSVLARDPIATSLHGGGRDDSGPLGGHPR